MKRSLLYPTVTSAFIKKKKNTVEIHMYVLKIGVYLQLISYLQLERMRDRRTLYNMTWQDFECCDSYVTERYTPHTLRDPLGNVSDRLSLIFSAPENTKKRPDKHHNAPCNITRFYSYYHFRPECISSGSRRWAHGRRVWRRSSHVQYERGYPPWSHRWATERFL